MAKEETSTDVVHLYDPMGLKLNRRLKWGLRLAGSAGLAIALVWGTLKATEGNIGASLYHARFEMLLFVLLLHGAVVFIAGCRWNALLRIHGVSLGVTQTFRLNLAGLFFNMALPGAVSGDIGKVLLLRKSFREKSNEVMVSVLLDRAIGLLGLFLVAAVMVFTSLGDLASIPSGDKPLKVFFFVAGIGAVIVITAASLVWLGKNPSVSSGKFFCSLSSLANRLESSFLSFVGQWLKVLKTYRDQWKILLWCVAVSVLIHCLLAFNLYCVALSLGETSARIQQYFVASPMGNLVASIPLTPGGIGTRDATVAALLVSMGASGELAGVVPLIMTFVILAWAIVGSVVFAFSGGSGLSFCASEVGPNKEIPALAPFTKSKIHAENRRG